jgi:hypothetical protein
VPRWWRAAVKEERGPITVDFQLLYRSIQSSLGDFVLFPGRIKRETVAKEIALYRAT